MEKEGIPKLEKRKHYDYCYDYWEEPLLDYAWTVANHLWPSFDGEDFCPSSVPGEFAEYYHGGEIDTSMENRYLEHEDVQNTLEAFGLDQHKFWYLCLMLKDVVKGFTEDARPRVLNAREELNAFVQEIERLEPELINVGEIHTFKDFKHAAELTLQVKEEERKNARTFTIRGPKTLFYLGVAVSRFLNEIPMPDIHQICDLDTVQSSDIFSGEMTTEKEIWRVALFHKYMDWFLKDHLKDVTVKRTLEKEINLSNGRKCMSTLKVDTSRQRLISRMIYVMGISENGKYDDPKCNTLKNNLKGEYKDPKPKNHNSRYCEL